MGDQYFDKETGESLDYYIDWQDENNIEGEYLEAGETVSTSTWAISEPAGLTLATPLTPTSTITGIWASGGTLGVTYRCKNTVVTSEPRTVVRSLYITIVER